MDAVDEESSAAGDLRNSGGTPRADEGREANCPIYFEHRRPDLHDRGSALPCDQRTAGPTSRTIMLMGGGVLVSVHVFAFAVMAPAFS